MNRVVRGLVMGVGILLGLIVLVGVVVYAVSSAKTSKKYSVTAPPLTIPTDSATLTRGKHLAGAISKCAECHGDDFAGQVVIDVPAMGRVVAANLTRATSGLGSKLTDADWIRAIRNGVRPDSTPIPLMPASDYIALGDVDLAAIIAYIKSVPPVEKTLPPNTLGLMGRALVATGKMPLYEAAAVDHSRPLTAPPATGVTVEYGQYLANIGGCIGCHGPTLSGGPVPGTPPDFKPARDLTPHQDGLKDWAETDFFRALRDGKRPDGSELDQLMPVRFTKMMTDDEIKAVWMYLRTVPPKAYGGR